ncbi:hypothetical protein GCM10009560_47110 [Nonomuraea longicatena]|uniref:Uncharacterized protein n=1 Tax=Nonomuraea longicatena TaxID=83682 RepID=A0ABP4AMH2_9ACTN
MADLSRQNLSLLAGAGDLISTRTPIVCAELTEFGTDGRRTRAHIETRPRGYRVLPVTRDGFVFAGHATPDDLFVSADRRRAVLRDPGLRRPSRRGPAGPQ